MNRSPLGGRFFVGVVRFWAIWMYNIFKSGWKGNAFDSIYCSVLQLNCLKEVACFAQRCALRINQRTFMGGKI